MTIVDVRSPVAVIAAVHGAAVETLAEDLEREGQPVLLVCLDRSRHDHGATRADVLHPPLMSLGIVAAALGRSLRAPGRVVRVVLDAFATRPSAIAAVLVRVPLALHLAQLLPRRGVAGVKGLDRVAEKIAAMVRDLCELAPPDLEDLPVDWARITAQSPGLRWLSRRVNSIAAELSLEGDQRLVVKRQRTHAGGSASARWIHESEVLRTLSESMADDTLTVPRIVLSDEETAILVMERASGASLDTMFPAARSDRAAAGRLVDGIRGAGAWLAAMQRVTRREADGNELLTQLVLRTREDVARLAILDRTIRRNIGRIVTRLEVLEARVNASPLPVTGHHDDYWPGNIFFDGRRVTVIDFESFRDGLWLEDAAYFLIRADMLRRRFRVALPDLAATFFSGYSPDEIPDRDALDLFTITKGLQILGKGVGDDLPPLQRIWTRRTIRKSVLRAVRGRP